MALEKLSPSVTDFFQQMSDVVRANVREHGTIAPTIMIQYLDEKGESAVQWQHFDPRDSRTAKQSIQLARQFAEAMKSECVIFFSEASLLQISDDAQKEWVGSGRELEDHPKKTPVIAAQLEVPGEFYIASAEIMHDVDGKKDFGPLLLEECDRSWIAGEVVDILAQNRGLKFIYDVSSKAISH